MSAFFLAINRRNAEFDADIASAMMSSIDHFGCDHRHLVVQANIALGYQSQWTVPEEQGEQQPLYDQASDTWFMFYGRIDNRAELLSLLSKPVSVSDAALLHAYLLTFGASRLGEVIGPFVFVLFDQRKQRVVAARDAMGGRHLVYKANNDTILIATYELALVAHPSVDYRFNDEKMGRIVAGMMEDQLSSNIHGLTPLTPGEFIELSADGTDSILLESKIFYRHDPAKRIVLDGDKSYADEFKRLLRQAVKRRMRSIGPLGSMMSGGFDSVPISILMAQELNIREEKLTALSWVHERYPEADEREYSADICARFNIDQVCIDCDDVWPQFDDDTHLDPIMPFNIPYTEYHQQAFRHAKRRGIKTVMTGIHGDLLYSHAESIFAELLSAGRWRDLYGELKGYWQFAPSKWQVVKHFILKQIPGVRAVIEQRRLARKPTSECLTDAINDLMVHRPNALWSESLHALRPLQYQVVCGGFAGDDIAMGRYMEAKYQVERRYPFRDRDLCEFMLSVPSDQLYFHFTPRPIVRRAFADELGPKLLARKTKTSFSSVVSDHIAKDSTCREWFSDNDAHWRQFVKQSYFDALNLQESGADIVMWRCGYYDYWKSVCYNRVSQELGKDNDN